MRWLLSRTTLSTASRSFHAASVVEAITTGERLRKARCTGRVALGNSGELIALPKKRSMLGMKRMPSRAC